MRIKANQVYTLVGDYYKILGVANDIIFISAPNDYDFSNSYYSTTEFINAGFELFADIAKECPKKPNKFRKLFRI